MPRRRPSIVAVLLATAACRTGAAGPPATPVPPAIAARVVLTRVAGGLSKPLFLAFAPGDDGHRLFVVEKTGTIRILRNGVVERGTPFLDFTGRVSLGLEQGLLGLAFHPGFARNGRLFVDFTDRSGAARVVELHVAADDPDRVDPASERDWLTVPQPTEHHHGGNLAFGPDGRLYVGLGDGARGGDPFHHGQDPNSLLAKMLAIDVDAAASAVPKVVALGLRNPWRYAFDRATGDLWIGDVGAHLFEEVDVLPAAALAGATPMNFGWSVVEGLGHCADGRTCDQHGFTLPVVEYSHQNGCAITGGYVYRGRRLPELVGLYFYADYCSGMVRSLRVPPPGEAVRDVWEWRAALDPESRLARLSSFAEDADGELYLLSLSGDVYRFDPRL